MSDARLEKSLQLLNRQRNAFAARLSGWSAERLQFRPDPHAWSALDIVDHILRVDADILSELRSNIAKPASIGLRDRLGALMVNSVMLSPIRVKVPSSATGVLPRPTDDLPELLTRWDQTHRAYGIFASELTAEQRRAGLFRHPVGGWISFAGALRFLSTHLRHHLYQLRRLEKATR